MAMSALLPFPGFLCFVFRTRIGQTSTIMRWLSYLSALRHQGSSPLNERRSATHPYPHQIVKRDLIVAGQGVLFVHTRTIIHLPI
ncbi:hypothetical protein P170DRAFT_431632 [Aspergillus steynii IBT 23096]|uniref:Uncharacterized protein n=1 Tax=Aspergillus steynii IBT 23096 TaxID=1392250 RepID=A0A2I2GLS4_9EURO|nr:uncharacterized protein P170DRAFT_431632 [Aspergillus steynii IBT 23096]PLB53831.1 hypothetical protein P170DRAFT_431632 [Aspergillus steynii IBT 23096]